MPSGHKAFVVQNPADVELLLMHNKTFAAEYSPTPHSTTWYWLISLPVYRRIGHAVSSRKRVEIIAKAKALGVKVTNPKGRVTTEA